MKNNKIFTEASGSIVSLSLITILKKSNLNVTTSDITKWNPGAKFADDYVVVPKHNNPKLWKFLKRILKKKKIKWVIPSLDETLKGWSDKRGEFSKYGINIIISPERTINTFVDKWKTYKAFINSGLPTPKTSLKKKFDLVKPRFGRGSKGIIFTKKKVKMKNYISQEKLKGLEITVDCLFDISGKPIYIIPRIRNKVIDGKSVDSKIIKNKEINKFVKILSNDFHFIGPINIQCFLYKNKVKFTELNPRIAGGMALSWAGTENWFKLWFEKILKNKKFKKKKIKYGLSMNRYYSEIFY